MSGIAAIIGRPNVGKSTFFNRLIESRKAIVDDQSGVTRDRHYGLAQWNGVTFSVIDTGGYVPESEDIFEKAIREQVHIAMEEADLLLFLVDVTSGLMPMDEEFAAIVRRSKKPVFLVANKTDTHERRNDALEFYSLGLGEIYPVSAVNGTGTGDLLDAVIEALPDKAEPFEEDLPKLAFVGRPNVGKSSIVNALLGRVENIVTPIAGTTRDTLHTRYQAFGHDIYLVDTAGLRKRAKVNENVEFYSTLRSIRAIEECDVAILMIDATLGMEAQDLAILNQIEKQRKGLVIVVNKWDLVEKETNTAKAYTQVIEERIKPLSGIPIIFVSVVEKQRVLKVLETAMEVYLAKKKMIPTSQLNEVMLDAIERYKPPAHRGRFIRIKYITQVPGSIPTFLFFCNHPKHIKENYKRYLENQLRENFGFQGTPINVFFREK
ncbi:MAG: ribosome biogenesis GTPase Der [Bacteroidia bacterium]|nr:ribosome biogenesis GTPase Der [Bacteroidia bacterium]